MKISPAMVKTLVAAVRKYGEGSSEEIPSGQLHTFEAADLSVIFIERDGRTTFHSVRFAIFDQVFTILADLKLVASFAMTADSLDESKVVLSDEKSLMLIEEWLRWRMKFLAHTGV